MLGLIGEVIYFFCIECVFFVLGVCKGFDEVGYFNYFIMVGVLINGIDEIF